MNYHAIFRSIQACLMAIIGLICIGFLSQAWLGGFAFVVAFLYLWLALEG